MIRTRDETWLSQRDHVLFLPLYNTRARVSEITGIKVGNVVLDAGAACVHLHGKGRSFPLWRSTVKPVRIWLRRSPGLEAASPLFPRRNGQVMTRANVAPRLAQALHSASSTFPDLAKRHISPHPIRHATAVHLLQAGVDIRVTAL